MRIVEPGKSPGDSRIGELIERFKTLRVELNQIIRKGEKDRESEKTACLIMASGLFDQALEELSKAGSGAPSDCSRALNRGLAK